MANHLNDISRLNSKLCVQTLKTWKEKKHEDFDWIAKTALRSLIKQGEKSALKFMGFNPDIKVKIGVLRLSKSRTLSNALVYC